MSQITIQAEAETLERLSIKHIQDKNWDALEGMLDPACQFVNANGSFDRDTAMTLMKGMDLGPVEFKDFKVTQSEDGQQLVVSFWLAALEHQDGKTLLPRYSPRLSVWKKTGASWKCVAYADFIGAKN